MTVKVASSGLFTIPTALGVGTATAQSASANTYSSVFVTQLASGTLGALYITGVNVQVVTSSSLHTGQYVNVQLATGASGSETVVGNVQIPTPGPLPAASVKYGGYKDFDMYPIPVAANTRIAAKTASDSAAALVWNVSLKSILQANVVADTNVNETVNAIQMNGTNLTARDVGASVLLSTGTGTGQVQMTSGIVQSNLIQVSTNTVSTTTAQLGVNAVAIGGTTQTGRDIGASVLLSTGTGTGQVQMTSGILQSNLIQISSASVSTTSAQLGTNVVTFGGTSVTGRDIGASVLLSSGTGAGQVSLVSGTVALSSTAPVYVSSGTGAGQVSLVSGTVALSSTAPVYHSSGTGTGQIVLNSGQVTVGTYTGNTVQTGDAFARLGVAGVGLTNLGDTRIANLDAAISTRSTYGGTDTSGTTTLLSRVTTAKMDNLNATISSRLASTAYTTDVNIASVAGVTVTGTGQSTDPWGP